jgi:putative DNA primase/helicase
MPTGQRSGFDVLDIDGAEGLASLEAYEAEHGPLPLTPTQVTGSGGRHYLFASTGEVRNSVKGMMPGWDTRGDGGYIVLAPSIHPETLEPYIWLDGMSALDVEAAAWPEHLLELYRAQAHTRTKIEPGQRIPIGVQESTLTSLAGTMRARGCDFPEILAAITALSETRCDPPLKEQDLERIANSITKLYAPDDPLVSENLTDTGNAKRFASLYRGRALYNHVRRAWLWFDGTRWREDETGQVTQWAKTTAYLISAAAINLPQDDAHAEQRQSLTRWGLASEDNRRLRAMLELAQDELAVTSDQLDADPWLFNVANGTLDLTTGTLRPHDPDDLITRISPVSYDPEAALELWDSTLSYALDGEREVMDFLQLLAGASLSGAEVDHSIAFVHGPGASGKTTITEAIRSAMGDYAVTADFSTFLRKSVSSGPSPEILSLRGARLVTSVEVDKGQALAEGLVKQMTGGDTVKARGVYARKAEEFTPTFTLWLVANDAPVIDQDDSGTWRRMVRVPFDRVVPEDERDPTLKLRLKDPAIGGPAVLAWLVKGCLKWQSLGMKMPQPERVKVATESYRESMDPLEPFIDEACELGPDLKVTAADLWSAYLSHCKTYRTRPIRQRDWVAKLKSRGIEPTKSGSTRLYRGVTLATSEYQP